MQDEHADTTAGRPARDPRRPAQWRAPKRVGRRQGCGPHGFTLVELVVVIVILAVLAAFVAPKFINLSSDARIATVQAAVGAVRTAATQANVKCRVTPTCVDVGGGQAFVPGPDGTTSGLSWGYPTGRVPAADAFWGINDWVSLQGFTAVQVQLWITDFTKDGAPDPANCKVRYSEGGGPNTIPNIVATTSGC